MFYQVDYWDLLCDHCIYTTNIRHLAFEKVFNPFIKHFRVYVGHVDHGIFIPDRLVARSATYLGGVDA